jgi:hypothetical protein
MREFALCFCVVVGLCVGLWAGNKYGSEGEREKIAGECKAGGSFTLRRTGFKCEQIKVGK